MAIFFPSEKNISCLKVSPTQGEQYLLNFLHQLSNEYEIYYQPFLNGDQPDIIIMRKNYGAMIIEVKDWVLNSYYIDTNKKWRIKANNSIIKSPIAQVKNYKENLYNLHIENLLEKKINDKRFFGIVSCAVYFHNETQETINKFIGDGFESENDKRFIKVFGNDSINIQKFNVILSEQGLHRHRPSLLFDDTLYNSFKRYLQPSVHILEQCIKIEFNEKQKQLAKSKSTPKGLKIKGVAGSGKTDILAQRAVNAHKRTNSTVLILTYNITLTNYIREQISGIKESLSLNAFYITDYYNFLTTEFNNLDIKIEIPVDFENWSSEQKIEYFDDKYYSNESIFEPVKEQIKKYQVILIDELQDYKKEWQRIIRKYFWDDRGEYVVFADIQQNIYGRSLDEYKDLIAVDIPGVWNVLKESSGRIEFNEEQKKLAKSKATPKGQKIKGVAGSGKTHILAQRAVDAHKRTNSKVLILTYNITLKNYIHDKISDVREEFDGDAFYITNYHNFLTTQLNNLGLEMEFPVDFEDWNNEKKTEYFEKKYYSNESIFEPVKEQIKKYQVILIDELQDYKEEWQRIIRKYFWDDGGEYVVFGDVKQNIYDRALDEYKDFKAVDIPGVWNVLKESFRLTTKVANIAVDFQKAFFNDKYNLDEINQVSQKNLCYSEEYYQYIYYEQSVSIQKIVDDIYSLIIKLNKHPNDICFLSQRIEIIREIDYFIRNDKHEKTQTMFESQEIYEKLKNPSNNEYGNLELKKIRDNKKFHFWMNPGTVKLSTIHSFKGWEIDTLFLIIENDYDDENSESRFSIDELIYTGLTRCRNNLIVVNISNQRYHKFFSKIY